MSAPEKLWAKSDAGFDGIAGTWLDEPDGPDMRPYTRDDIVQALIAEAEARGWTAAIEAVAKRCDTIAGNTKDFTRDYRRAAGHCAVEARSLKKGE